MEHTPDFETSYQHAASGLVVFMPDGTILHANKTLLGWLDIAGPDIEKMKLPELFAKGGKLYYNLFVQPLLQLHGEVNEISFELNTANGALPVLFSASLHGSNSSKTKAINGVIFKITERKSYEFELLKKNNQIQEQNMIQNLVLNEMAYKESHLVRAPLASILGLIHLLEADAEVNADNKTIISMLKTSADNLDRVITGIIDMANMKNDR